MASPLQRTVGLPGAVLLGLGAMLGTGAYVVIPDLALRHAPATVFAALAVAALVAWCNGLSSARLAAAHPVAGGTYAYGRAFATPLVGQLAGWLFLIAKSLTAVAAAKSLAAMAGLPHPAASGALAMLAVVIWTALILVGLRRTAVVNLVLVAVGIIGLGLWATHGVFVDASPAATFEPISGLTLAALIFVAFTGYGRIATLGEEIREPQRNIPQAVLLTVVTTALLYGALVWATPRYGLAAGDHALPLPELALSADLPVWQVGALTLGLLCAVGGVLLNLILGLSRVVLAMARHRDLPAGLAELDARHEPRRAILAVALALLLLIPWGDVRLAWAQSAAAVLLYYGLTNLVCIGHSWQQRRRLPWFALAGGAGCLLLATQVPLYAWPLVVGICLPGLAFSRFAIRK
ncbi:MAG: APC family permease [Verrucomicrobiota bacterium JB022]|nr:APC family permease [Verrucomicrobiota bacterium JB022]